MGYYIISIKHTEAKGKYFTLWRANNSGYTIVKEAAGIYEQFEPGYHDSGGNFPIETTAAEDLFLKENAFHVIPNILRVRKELGLKIKDGYLVKM